MTSTPTTTPGKPSRWKMWGLVLGGLVVAGAAWQTQARWLPAVQAVWNKTAAVPPAKADAQDEHDHAGHDHSHAGHDELSSIELTEQGRKSIGLKSAKITLGTFVRTVTVPGMVVERPGRTKIRIVAPLTGIVTKIYAMQGEAIRPGQPLFDVRLTHEDMVQAQVEFLKTVEELAVVEKEIARLAPVAESGALPQKTLLERKYEQQKLLGSLKAQRESLLLHGLSELQTEEIEKSRSLRSKQTAYAPGKPLTNGNGNGNGQATEQTSAAPDKGRVFVVEQLQVETGRYVNTGDLLLTLADYSELFVEGNAFEQDGQLVADVLRDNRKITIRVENHSPAGTLVPDLEILYLSDQIDSASRTLHFYLRLPNEQLRDAVVDGHRFVNWRFKPGQRTQLLVPIEEWSKRIVLPADAVVQDGVESYVFQQNGDHFDRRAVQVEYRDRQSVVIAQDGSLFPGDVVAINGAQQLLVALKNKAGGGVDPHAGHNH